MAKFTLLNKLQQIDECGPEEVSRIQYQNYTIVVEKHDQVVSIPVRECMKFEQELEEYEKLSNTELRKLMREFRGLVQK